MTIRYAAGLSGPGIIARCKALEGRPNKPGYCLYEQLTRIFLVPGVGDYDSDGDADCLDYWKAAKKRGTVVETTDPDKIPVGALLIWAGRYGHAATYMGNGKIFSTDLPTRARFGIVPLERPHTAWGHQLLGYVVVDGNGFTLLRETKPTPPAKPKLQYRVSDPAGVNVRTSPSIKGTKTGALSKGTKVTADKVVVAEGRHWVSRLVNKKRVYMAREFFEQVKA